MARTYCFHADRQGAGAPDDEQAVERAEHQRHDARVPYVVPVLVRGERIEGVGRGGACACCGRSRRRIHALGPVRAAAEIDAGLVGLPGACGSGLTQIRNPLSQVRPAYGLAAILPFLVERTRVEDAS